MSPEPVRSHGFAFRVFPILCLLLLPPFAAAQSSADYCEPSDAVKEDIRNVNHVNYENLPFATRRERQISMLQELLKK